MLTDGLMSQDAMILCSLYFLEQYISNNGREKA